SGYIRANIICPSFRTRMTFSGTSMGNIRNPGLNGFRFKEPVINPTHLFQSPFRGKLFPGEHVTDLTDADGDS
ncbi:MAG TPA: hypothetical protein VNO70_28015, partial [Blastocatellia bacterium]|nr:hypothetical protein [Blastocatellia bacterium]